MKIFQKISRILSAQTPRLRSLQSFFESEHFDPADGPCFMIATLNPFTETIPQIRRIS